MSNPAVLVDPTGTEWKLKFDLRDSLCCSPGRWVLSSHYLRTADLSHTPT